ncbi:hypothetical protein 162319385 [Organic Lake phycodnavirus 2]|nr:hypothetical protein 162319385 [Organic Lake phycodnavirus 2]
MDHSTLNHMMNNQLFTMVSMKDNVSMYQVLGSLIFMNALQYLPQIKSTLIDYIKKTYDKKNPI